MSKSQIEVQHWRERWKVERELVGGAQANAFLAESISDGSRAFLKVLRSQDDPERRARFFREASAYGSFSHGSLPSLVETNAGLHADIKPRLYIATEFVEGPTLAEYVGARGPMELSTALLTVRGLAAAIAYLHQNRCVHRDIKPDNIMLRRGQPGQPVLVDFGLSYTQRDEEEFQTEDWQELGNRFLRLPELAVGSLAKQDPVSDVTFASGILFYLLTAHPPVIPFDADGKLPHQREYGRALKEQGNDKLPALLRLFDKAFHQRSIDRYQTVADLSAALDRIEAYVPHHPDDPDAALAGIVEDLKESNLARFADQQAKCTLILNAIRHIVQDEIVLQLQNVYVAPQANQHPIESGMHTELGIQRRDKPQIGFMRHIDLVVAGDELVLTFDNDVVARLAYDHPDLGGDTGRAIRSNFIKGLQGLLDRE